MTEPADDDMPPAEDIEMEVEMGAEDFLGRALSGTALERIEALTKRVQYLEDSISRVLKRGDLDPAEATVLDCLRKDLAEAKRQLADWQAKYEARN